MNYGFRVGIIQEIFVNIADFSCVDFQAASVLILLDQNLLIHLHQTVLILFVSGMFNGNKETFWHNKLCMKIWYSSKNHNSDND